MITIGCFIACEFPSISDLCALIPLDATVRLPVLAESTVLSGLVIVAVAVTATGGLATSRTTCLATLAACLDRVNFAAGEFLVHALVGLAVLAKTVVLCRESVRTISAEVKMFTSGLVVGHVGGVGWVFGLVLLFGDSRMCLLSDYRN